MATQGLVSVIRDGSMLFKVVAGANGFRADEVAAWARLHSWQITAQALFEAAVEIGFGGRTSLVVQDASGAMVFDKSAISEEDLTGLYLDRGRFDDPRASPRSEVGTSEYVEIVELAG